MFQLQNHVTKDELADAEVRTIATPRTMERRINQMVGVLEHIRMNRDLHLNETLDELLIMEADFGKKTRKRSNSMIIMQTPEHNDLGDDVSEVLSVDSFPGYKIKLEEKLSKFEEFKKEKNRLSAATAT